MTDKTVEVLCKNPGPCGFCIGETQHTVVFEDKGGIGRALVTGEEADHLLGGIGWPFFWKPGRSGPQGVFAAEDLAPAPAKEPAPTGLTLTLEGYEAYRATVGNRDGLPALLEALKTCEDQPLLMSLVAAEAQASPTRASWMTALNERLDAIQAPAQTPAQ